MTQNRAVAAPNAATAAANRTRMNPPRCCPRTILAHPHPVDEIGLLPRDGLSLRAGVRNRMRVPWPVSPHVVHVPEFVRLDWLRSAHRRERRETGHGHGARGYPCAAQECATVDHTSASLTGGREDCGNQFVCVPLRSLKGSFTVAITPSSSRCASAMTRSEVIDS